MAAPLEKITPEEKLLHLIEGSQEYNKLYNKKKVSAKTGSFLFFSGKSPFHLYSLKNLSLRTAVKLLISISIIATIIVAVYLTKDNDIVREKIRSLQAGEIKTEFMDIDIKQKGMPDQSTFYESTKENNPFHMIPYTEDTPAVQEYAEEKMELQLVGILWSDESQAIIEDGISGNTYVVSAGDTIDVYTITEITQTEVILKSQNGKKILK
ncbi:MAG: hypothetical protein ABH869_02230 [Candidatus Omnitrophota bacterium]